MKAFLPVALLLLAFGSLALLVLGVERVAALVLVAVAWGLIIGLLQGAAVLVAHAVKRR